MTRIKDKTRPIRVFAGSIALSVVFWSVSASLERLSAQDRKASGTMYTSKRMADGKQWIHATWTSRLCRPTATKARKRIAASMGVCTRGSRRRERVYPWETDGDCRRTMNGGRWRRPTAASARIRRTRVKRHTRRSWPEAARDFMRCSAAAVPRMATMRDWKPTDSIGLHRRSIRRTDGTTTSVKAGWLSTVKTVVRSRERFPFGASESDDCSVPPLLNRPLASQPITAPGWTSQPSIQDRHARSLAS